MKIYMMAESGSTRPIKMRTIRSYSSLESLGKRLVNVFKEKRPNRTFEDWVCWGNNLEVFELNVDSNKIAKRLDNEAIWKAMVEVPALHSEIASVMLVKS